MNKILQNKRFVSSKKKEEELAQDGNPLDIQRSGWRVSGNPAVWPFFPSFSKGNQRASWRFDVYPGIDIGLETSKVSFRWGNQALENFSLGDS